MSQRHAAFPIIRPPHAVDEASFLDECTRCEACIKSCPHDAIVHAPARFRAAAGTPMIDPHAAPCRACADTPCVSACEPNVLRLDAPFAMGSASIDTQSCLAHQGSFCTVCSEHCPVPGAISTESGKPTVNASACTGCGVCHYVCPAPQNAVLVIPNRARPTPSELNNANGAKE
ncbi:MAG: 4Fe-4S binding protein [Phycisphaerales bacterium]